MAPDAPKPPSVDEYVALPVDPRSHYFHIRSFASDLERQLALEATNERWGHIRPGSVLVTAMGYHWSPGSWQRVVDMVRQTNAGLPGKDGKWQHPPRLCDFSEIQDRCFNPYDALGTMRNEAYMYARLAGYEWLCYIDNDIQPNPDVLQRLLNWDMPVVAPWIVEPGTGKPLHGPICQPNTGLRRVKWCVLSMLVIHTSVLTPWANGSFWSDAIGADEGIHFQRLAAYGHYPFLDTNTPVALASDKRPLYPLAMNRLPPDRRQAFLENKIIKLTAPPDRRPIDPREPNQVNGEYNPFIQPVQPSPQASGLWIVTSNRREL